METSSDYEDLFRTFNAYRIKYLVVGAHAVGFHTVPRYTKDLDLWVPPELNDPRRVFQALRKFGAPLPAISTKDFTEKDFILQIGVEPVRVDIIVDLAGVSARAAWKNRRRSRYGKTPIWILGLDDLICAKRKAGRDQDLLDLEKLLAHRHSR